MRKTLLPVILIIPTLLLSGCTVNNTPAVNSNSSESNSNSTDSPTPKTTNTYDPNLKLDNTDSSLGLTSIKVPPASIDKDGSFPAPAPTINAQPPADAPAEQQAIFNDFKSVVTATLNKLLTEGGSQTTNVSGGSSFQYAVDTKNNILKAAMSSPDGKSYLLENLNPFIPVIAEQALNASKGSYSYDGNNFIVNTKYATYIFSVNSNIITSVSCTGKPEIEGGDFASWEANIIYPVTQAGKTLINKAVPMAW